jgi:hypothetical protein
LDLEDIVELPIVPLRPQVIAVGNVDELRGHAQSATRFAHAAFENRVHLQLAADFTDVFALSLEGK